MEAMDYPRVLILSRTEISEYNSQGAALGGWFRDWPKDRLAQMYSSRVNAAVPYCGCNYLLSGKERRFGRLFNRLKGAAGARGGVCATPSADPMKEPGWPGRLLRTARQWGWKGLVDTGLNDVCLPPRLSPPLLAWVADFRPDVIFAAVTDLGYVRFAALLHEEFRLPICLEIADDWPTTRYRNTPIGFATFRLSDRRFRDLLRQSAICLTIGKEMERDYRSRYAGNFEALMCCEEPARFLTAEPRRDSPPDEIAIAYCGGVGLHRWRPMVDLLEAVGTLRSEGLKVTVTIYTSEYPPEAAEAFGKYPHVRLRETPRHAEVPGILKGADILFHGEGFEPDYRRYIRLSVSSKSQLYMISGVPILVYGPADAGVIKYARQDGWACVVDRPDRELLKEAVRRLSRDQELRRRLVNTAKEVFYQNHNAATVRNRLRQVLSEAAASARHGLSAQGA
jgi:glycosyltransferase involved in cell wall biosynthesis